MILSFLDSVAFHTGKKKKQPHHPLPSRCTVCSPGTAVPDGSGIFICLHRFSCTAPERRPLESHGDLPRVATAASRRGGHEERRRRQRATPRSPVQSFFISPCRGSLGLGVSETALGLGELVILPAPRGSVSSPGITRAPCSVRARLDAVTRVGGRVRLARGSQ